MGYQFVLEIQDMGIRALKKDITIKANAQRATLLQRYFKTGKGEYAEGDIFLGLTVPQCRQIANKYRDLAITESKTLLQSKYHEERLIALLILVDQFSRYDNKNNKLIFDTYLSLTNFINNWDLVDLTAPKIIGKYLFTNKSDLLFKLAASDNLWERRIAVLATFYFIQQNSFIEALQVAKILVNDKHDLIHKAVGWMLREIGKRDLLTEEKFLKKYLKVMPRTMLRYAIEKFPEEKRRQYLMKVHA